MANTADTITQALNGMITLMMVKMMTNDMPHAIGILGADETDEYMQKEAELTAQYGRWEIGRARSVCPAGDTVCMERVARRFQKKAIR